MREIDPNPVPRRPTTKILYIVLSLVVVLGLCVVACRIANAIIGDITCGITNPDTPERCR